MDKTKAGLIQGLPEMRQKITDLGRPKLAEAQGRYHSLFENVPISLWEEDFSAVKTYLDGLRRDGVIDFRDFFENDLEAVVHCAEMVRVIDVNQATLKLYRAESKEQLLRGLGQVFGEDSYNVFREELIALAEGHTQFESEALTHTLTGDKKYVYLTLSLATGYEDTWSRVLVSVSDITKRKQAEEELRSSCEYLERVNDSLEEVIFTIKWPERLIRYVNYSVKHVFGYEIEECIGKSTGFLYPTNEEYQSLGDMLTKAIERGEDSLHAEQLLKKKNGEVFSAEITHTFFKEDGKTTQATGILRDITERKHAEKELRVLSRKVVQIQEEERRTIARELHDQIGQSLTLINLLLDKALRPPSKNVAPSLNEAKTLVNELVGQVRNLSLSLHPSMLDDLGLLPTLLWYFGTITTKTQVRIEFKHSGLNNCFPQEVKTAAYRIVQEALTNVVRHAKVNRVDVASWVDQDTLCIRIEDGGAGFNPRALPLGASRGLYGMREWAHSIGGELTVESSPGVGTTITARLPIGHLR